MKLKGWCALLFMLPHPVAADVQIRSETLQKGVFLLTDCEPQENSANDCLCQSDLTYPQLSGVSNKAFENEANELFRSQVESMQCEGSPINAQGDTNLERHIAGYKVTYSSPALISITFSFADYTGGAHPDSGSESMIIDVAANKILDIEDIIAPEKQPALNAYIKDRLQTVHKNEIYTEEGMVPSDYISGGVCEGCSLSLDKNGALLTFQPYAVGPYSSGFIEERIPAEFITHNAILAIYPGR